LENDWALFGRPLAMLMDIANPMKLHLSPDHADLLSALNAHGAKYLVVGGYAVGAYTQPRATKDLDVFILCNAENSEAVFHALADFGAPIAGYTPSDFNDRRSYFQMGEPPWRVDILQVISGVAFEESWESRVYAVVNGKFETPVISAEKLIQNKLAAGRPRDLLDVEEMRRAVRLLKRYEVSSDKT
jgi:hypothetical protein